VEIDPNSKKVIVDDKERTSVPNIYGIGDVIHVCLLLFHLTIRINYHLVEIKGEGFGTIRDQI
jgi:pyruvate/2-oxoglutarate dehydrogenase complex dihydrolipoamide dehydrogenase (E3) component